MWDLFCEVVDNYGDAGVSWRLARMLANEHGLRVRLWIDKPQALSKLNPHIDPAVALQYDAGVEIRKWDAATEFFDAVEPGEVVIEAFGCRLPESFVARMATRTPQPIWINLEYLTAEAWALGCHTMASPHPRLPLVKYFFFPGFDPRSGGLLREAGLLDTRDRFQTDQVEHYWPQLGMGPSTASALRISLFCYDSPMIAALLDAWANADEPVSVLLPEGAALHAVCAFFGVSRAAPGERFQRGNLQLQVLPFVEQPAYDRLLWACDFNFVRGEDSFVRAQWAGRPLIWQAYVQDEQAHLRKLEAFLDLYCAELPAAAGAAVRDFMQYWNGGSGQQGAGEIDVGRAWQALRAHRGELKNAARRWADQLADGPELANTLVSFAHAHVKSRLF